MLNFIIFLLANIGFTIIVTQSKIVKPLREFFCKISPNFLGSLFKCCLCIGFWTGVITSLLWFSPVLAVAPISIFLYPIFDGFISSIICYTFYLLIKPLMNKYD